MLSKKEQKYIQSLKIKKYRTREKRFLVEGQKNVLELLGSDFNIELIVATASFSDSLGVQPEARLEVVSEGVLSTLGAFKSNDSVIAVVHQKEPESFAPQGEDMLFALDGVGDPGNLGTIIRTLDWFGYKQLLCSLDCADFYNPKTIASTMGSFTRMEIFYVELKDTLESLQLPVYGADMHGDNIFEAQLKPPGVVLMGSESHGIRQELRSLMTQSITIPKIGNAESLNVAIATGIIAGHLRTDR